jgi:hypothetical protein
VKRNGSKQRRKTIQVWTYEQARHVLPYVGSIMRTLRENRLQAQQHHLQASRLKNRRGRLDRNNLIAFEEATRCAQEAEARFQDALEELHTLDIYCLDAVRGLALIPFARGEDLAWFIFDLFDNDPLRFWRYHQDTLETRRPITEIPEGPSRSNTVIV